MEDTRLRAACGDPWSLLVCGGAKKNVALSLVSTRMVALRKLLTGQWTSSSLLHGTGCSHRQRRSWISSTPTDLKRHGAGLHARTVSPGSIAVYIRLLASIGSQISKSYVWFVSMFFINLNLIWHSVKLNQKYQKQLVGWTHIYQKLIINNEK